MTYMQSQSSGLPWEQSTQQAYPSGAILTPAQSQWEQLALPWEVSSAFTASEANTGKWQDIMAAVYQSIATPGNPLAPLEDWQDDDSSGSELLEADVAVDDLLQIPIEEACRKAYGAYLFHKKRWRVISGRRLKK